ncbi:serine/threonine-protein phosphatase 6 regulatory ankyrin repeat subunit B-like isoform X2 [Haliotis asinina]|uniref:serine/threonine-protein phosphatase 6 regulatory ankyrin repeat subunit B-like isoform X2 n=1 Tax=Haliotis asinina TaxID=109174 RepID=UPI0035322B71
MEEDQTTTDDSDTEIRECTPEHRRKHYNLDTSSSEEYLELAGIASENPQGANEGAGTEIGECTPAECRTDSDVATSSGMEDAGNMAVTEDSADEFSDSTNEDEGDGIRDISQLGAGAVGVKFQTAHQESYQLVGKVAQYNLIQVQQQFGDVTVKGGKNLNIGGTQNVGTTLTKQEEEKPLTAAQKIRKRTTSRIQSWIKDMVETDALKKVKEKLDRGATWVTITGRPGEGKSTTAYMALQDQRNQGRQVYQVVSPEEFNEVIMACSNPVILLDDIFGDLEFVAAEWMKWRPSLRPILDVKHPDEDPDEVSMGISTKTEKVSERTEADQTQVKQSNPNKNKTIIILVGRDYVLKSSLADLGRMADYISSPQYVVKVSSQRDSYERRKIWRVHAEAKNINFKESVVSQICGTDCPHGFPHVCKMFVTAYQKDWTQFPPETFFQAPIAFLYETLNKLLKDEEKRSLFMAMIKRDGKISGQEMEEDDSLGYKHRDVADDLVGSYLRKEDDTFMFDHPSIYDSVSFILSTKQLKFVIENCSLSFINQRLRLALPRERKQNIAGEEDLVANIPWTYARHLVRRFASEINRGNLLHVLSHQACCNSDFVHLLMDCLKTQFHMCASDIVKLSDELTNQSFCELLSSNKSDHLLKYIMEKENISFTPDEGRDILLGVCENAACSVLKYISGHMELDVNARYGEEKRTPLMLAAETRDSLFVNQIMSLDPDLNARDSLGVSVFYYLCENGLTLSVERVLDMGVEVNEDQGLHHELPLYIAIQKGHLEVVKLLVNRGCDVDNQKGLRCAVVSMNSNMVLFFLNRRVEVDSTVVCRACAAGDLNIVKMVFGKGATVNMVSHDGDTPLHSACQGNSTVVAYLLKKGARVNQASDDTGDTPLHRAAMWGSTECADVLLKAGADVNVQNNTGDTPLHRAAKWECTECADVLLKAGADVNAQDNTGDTPLHAAAGTTSTECVDVLLKAGAGVNIQNNAGDAPLHAAADQGFIEFVDVLQKVGTDVIVQNNTGDTTLHAASERRSTVYLDALLKAGADVHIQNDTGDTPLHAASENKFTECVDALLKAGADVHIQNDTGDTPLHTAAAEWGSTECVDLLLKAGAAVNVQNDRDDTPLHAAAWCGSGESVDALLKAGADVNMQNDTGDTPLHRAASASASEAWWRSTECVDVLLKAGADVNVQNDTGDTPLHVAAGWQSTGRLDVLLKAGADVNVQNNTGYTPLHRAAEGISAQCVSVLLKAGADVNVQNKTGDTPLHTAAWCRSTHSIDVLLKAGADVNVQNNTGNTPLHRAAANTSTHCVEVLLKARADVNVQNNTGDTPLHRATARTSIECVGVLQTDAADVNVQNNTGDTTLHRAAARTSTECVDVLLTDAAYVTVQHNTGDTPVHMAEWGFTKCVDMLLKAGADVNVQNNSGQKPLH